MCIFFDKNFYSDMRDDETCYKYMYLIYHMLACKKRFFHNYEDYDLFAQYAATTIYTRFLKKEADGAPRIKSILNYAKKTVYPLKVMYQKQEYKNIVNSELDDGIDSVMIENHMKDTIQQQYDEGLEEAVQDVLRQIPYYVIEVINNTPYSNNKLMKRKLYISCVISLLKSVVLSTYNIDRLKKRELKDSPIGIELLRKMYTQERENSITLWKLDDSMVDYVKVLTNLIRKRIVEEIVETRKSFLLSTEMMDAVLMSAWDSKTHSANTEDSEDME